MTQELLNQLAAELEQFTKLDSSSPIPAITDSYNQLLGTVQAMMLSSDNPDAHARAWSLLKDDAYKDLSEIQEGKTATLEELKVKISQIEELLLHP